MDAFAAPSGLTAVHCAAIYPCHFRDLGPEALPEPPSHRALQRHLPGYAARLRASGDLGLLTLDFDARREEALGWLPRLYALHDLRHSARRNLWKERVNREFLRQWLETAERSQCLAFLLLVDGLPVAFNLGVRIGTTFSSHITAFHPAFQKLSL